MGLAGVGVRWGLALREHVGEEWYGQAVAPLAMSTHYGNSSELQRWDRHVIVAPSWEINCYTLNSFGDSTYSLRKGHPGGPSFSLEHAQNGGRL